LDLGPSRWEAEAMTGPLKTFTLARRRPEVSHDHLIHHWRDTHAPNVVRHLAPDRYALTFFDPRDGKTPFTGMAELGFDDAARGAAVTGRNFPPEVARDGWADGPEGGLVELPTAWLRVREHVIVAGPGGRTTPAHQREQAFKLTFLLTAAAGVSLDELIRHWLEIHVPNFASNFEDSGGLRYVVNVAERAANTDLVGLAEISYRSRDAAQSHQVPDDGFRAMIGLRALPGREQVITG
jgi:hypothetical protein